MKKLIVFALIISLFSVISVNADDTYNYYDIYSDICYYRISKNDFCEFINNPSETILNECNTFAGRFYVNGKKDNGKNELSMVELNYKNGQTKSGNITYYEEEYGADGYSQIITEDNLKYLTKENLLKVIKDNGIDANIKNYAIFTVDTTSVYCFPITVWIQTESGENFFLVQLKMLNEQEFNVDYSKAQFMTMSEYYNKFSVYSGNIKINGEEKNLQNPIQFQCNNIYVPLEDLLKVLGSTYVEFSSDNKIYFDINGKYYMIMNDCLFEIYSKEYSYEYTNNRSDNTKKYIADVNIFYNDGQGYIETFSFDNILKVYNKKYIVDYDNYSINIVNIDEYKDNENFNKKIEFSVGSNYVWVNEQKIQIEMPSYIQVSSGSVMIPLAAVTSATECVTVNWIADTKTAVVTKGVDKISFIVGENSMLKNDEEIVINAVAEIKDNRIYVPLRALSEALGLGVEWIADTKTVILR